jgi:hypothetical protein
MNKTNIMLIALLASILLSSVFSIKRGERLKHHLTDEQMKALQEEAKYQSEIEKDFKPPRILNYPEFVGRMYSETKPTKKQLTELDQETIMTVKHFFSDKSVKLSKERYGALLIMLMDGTAHDQDIDEDIRDVAIEKIKDYVTTYLKPKELLKK